MATVYVNIKFDSLGLPYLAYAHNACIRALQCATVDAVASQTEHRSWVATAAAHRKELLSVSYRWQPEDQDGHPQRNAIDVQNHKPYLGWTSREHGKSKKRLTVPG